MGRLASPGKRLGAFVLDVVLRFVVLALIFMLGVLLLGCEGSRHLNRRRAADLIRAEMVKSPLTVAVETRVSGDGTVDKQTWSDLLSFLQQEGFQPTVLDKPTYTPPPPPPGVPPTIIIGAGWALWVELPVEESLKVGKEEDEVFYPGAPPTYVIEPKRQLLRYGEEPRVEVTGITQGQPGEAEAEFRYAWTISPKAQEALNRIEAFRAKAMERFGKLLRKSFLDIGLRGKKEGEGKAKLKLYDDGWRVVDLRYMRESYR